MEVLTQEERKALESPIVWDEIEEAMSSLPWGKAAGLDLIPMEFYRIFKEELKEILISVFLPALEGGHHQELGPGQKS